VTVLTIVPVSIDNTELSVNKCHNSFVQSTGSKDQEGHPTETG